MRQRTFKTQDVVIMLAEQHLRVDQVAKLLGVSRQAIWKRLKHDCIDIAERAWVDSVCAFCTKPIHIRLKLQRTENFCNMECYAASRENPGFKPWRHGSRLARALVGQYFPLEPQHIVHHKDDDERNNDRVNLMVFANQSDHMKFHHGKTKVEPLWDGAQA